MSKGNCELYIMTGNCPQQQICQYNHPLLQKIKKSKLQYKKQIFNRNKKTIQTNKPTCSCCKGNTLNCQNSFICQQLQKCTCVASQQQINDFYNQACDCCFGNVYECQSTLCEQLGMCQCQLQKNIESQQQNIQNEYFEQSKNCKCCKGYVFICQGKNCKDHCICFN